MQAQSTAKVRFFGCLHTLRRERGLASETEVPVPDQGLTGEELAHALALPLEMVEAVVVNRKVYGLEHRVRPGDRVAFVPRGTPGPHRFALGIYSAGRGEGRKDP
ncbi:MAG: hypothetical protein P1P84_02430 [Deferrisomatales bacterium]|nr:hypothetical protein [Deferrisomatales bacterium]